MIQAFLIISPLPKNQKIKLRKRIVLNLEDAKDDESIIFTIYRILLNE
jgi:hypothetical protein